MDSAQKKAGVPYSTSRAQERAAKKNTHKKRRAEDAQAVRAAALEDERSTRAGAPVWLSWRAEP
jgi:hypothetical protein